MLRELGNWVNWEKVRWLPFAILNMENAVNAVNRPKRLLEMIDRWQNRQ